MKVVCTSDTHGMHKHLDVPEGDLFIFAGDISELGKEEDLIDFNNFLSNLPHRCKLIIDGNHDLEPEKISGIITSAIYLQHKLIEFENIRIWGTSWRFWLSDQIQRRKDQMNPQGLWEAIPTGIDILITHFPPHGIGDLTRSGTHLGVKDLNKAISRIKPRYHIFGHVHEAYGIYKDIIDGSEITFINASSADGFSTNLNPPVVFEV